MSHEEAMNEDEALIDKAEAARLLGVSVRTVEGWVAQTRLPFIRLGDGKRPMIRFRPSALRDWVRSQEVRPGDNEAKGEQAQ